MLSHVSVFRGCSGVVLSFASFLVPSFYTVLYRTLPSAAALTLFPPFSGNWSLFFPFFTHECPLFFFCWRSRYFPIPHPLGMEQKFSCCGLSLSFPPSSTSKRRLPLGRGPLFVPLNRLFWLFVPCDPFLEPWMLDLFHSLTSSVGVCLSMEAPAPAFDRVLDLPSCLASGFRLVTL